MQKSLSNFVQVAVSAAVLATAFTLPAAAAVAHRRSLRPSHHRMAGRPLTVTRQYSRPDPYQGPAAIITAPVAFAGTIVGLPFRALGVVFPAHGNPANNPLVLVGAPVHVAGQIAQFPFYAADSAFGVPPDYY